MISVLLEASIYYFLPSEAQSSTLGIKEPEPLDPSLGHAATHLIGGASSRSPPDSAYEPGYMILERSTYHVELACPCFCRAGVQQGISERGAAFHQVLAVVQNQERLLGLQMMRKHVWERGAGALAPAKTRGNRLWHEIGVRKRCQLDPPHA